MIIAAIVVLSALVISLLVHYIANLPVLPSQAVQAVMTLLPYVTRGVTFFNDFVFPSVVWLAIGSTLGLRMAYISYRLVMWVVKKIPMLSVED